MNNWLRRSLAVGAILAMYFLILPVSAALPYTQSAWVVAIYVAFVTLLVLVLAHTMRAKKNGA